MIYRALFCILFFFAVTLGSLCYTIETRAEAIVEAKANKVLLQMSDYLNTLEQFTLHTENSVDVILESGQKVQLSRSVDVFVRRPDRFRANVDGDHIDQELFYDGKSITLFGNDVKYYASLKAPGNIEAALAYAIQAFGLVAPLSDFICRDSYAILTQGVYASFYMGLSNILGMECHHLAFRGEEVDWQVWIESGKRPLPRKFIITSKWVAGAPQFTALLTKWDLTPQLNDSLFAFVPPENAEKITFIPVSETNTPGK